ncbi:MAG TPA: selenocysteine-specific translation elongation factor [Solirubrobacteraceae bacterium]|nr:selenocysteine-specific translation elongation factor [Solirubrobacteraceae bacterium]
MSGPAPPLTVGTAGHVDHGKTALVAALTGVDTDRLPEEKARGLTIVLGYAPLLLPDGRQASLVDVPGHERFVRTMVAGATGIDLFLLVVAADDGLMPQTLEHVAVLRALGIERGVVAITKSDLADPARAEREARALLPGVPAVRCSVRDRQALKELACALGEVAQETPSRAASSAPARLHIDRVFTVAGRGTVVTGTLWSGAIGVGEALELLPACVRVRVRGVEVHDRPVERAAAGQRVAVNLRSQGGTAIRRGDVLANPGTYGETHVLDCALSLRDARHGQRVQVHHGTRAVAARLVELGDGLFQLRAEAPLLAADGDRVVVRRVAPADTLGGGTVLDAHARRHGRREEIVERLARLRAGELAPHPDVEPLAAPQPRAVATPRLAALEEVESRLREAGTALLSEAQLAATSATLAALREESRAVRVSGRLYAHPATVADVRARVLSMIERDGCTRLADVRDELAISRKSAQAFLEHLDAARVTTRLPDDRRVAGPRAHARQERLA